MIDVVVSGAAGRMGRAIVAAVAAQEGVRVSGAVEREGHSAIGQDAGQLAGLPSSGILVTSDLLPLLDTARVLIEFTAPESTLAHLEACARRKVAAVVGTTGLNSNQTLDLEAFASQTPVVFAPNMSVGVNLLFKLAAQAAAVLGEDYDAEIVEAHHRMKKDAPSGTALKLAQMVAEARGRSLDASAVYARKGLIGERTRTEIGIQTVRAGDIVGEHTLILAAPGERLELIHRATSRDNFARGAVRAALWVAGKAPGLYSMQDVLGLK